MANLDRLKSALSSVHHAWCFYEPSGSIVSLLERNLSHIDPTSWISRLEWGGVYVNGRAARFDFSPFPPFRLEYFEPKFDFQNSSEYFPQFSTDWIVFEDEFLIVASKPHGIACLPTREQRNVNLKRYLDDYVGHPIHMPSRLDTSTSGLVVVSKHSASHRGLQMLFQRREIQKRYLFETASKVRWDEITVEASIGKDRSHPILRKVIDDESSKPALTHLRKITTTREEHPEAGSFDATLIAATPKTGRTHQIRVHSSHLGIPIIGDNFYGGFDIPGLRLFSYELEFHHPITDELLIIRAPSRHWPNWAARYYSSSNSGSPELTTAGGIGLEAVGG